MSSILQNIPVPVDDDSIKSQVMPKQLHPCSKFVLLIAFSMVCIDIDAQTQSQLSISVSGIDFSDPSFALLKESIEKNKKAGAVKQYYGQSTGKLNFQCKATIDIQGTVLITTVDKKW